MGKLKSRWSWVSAWHFSQIPVDETGRLTKAVISLNDILFYVMTLILNMNVAFSFWDFIIIATNQYIDICLDWLDCISVQHILMDTQKDKWLNSFKIVHSTQPYNLKNNHQGNPMDYNCLGLFPPKSNSAVLKDGRDLDPWVISMLLRTNFEKGCWVGRFRGGNLIQFVGV